MAQLNWLTQEDKQELVKKLSPNMILATLQFERLPKDVAQWVDRTAERRKMQREIRLQSDGSWFGMHTFGRFFGACVYLEARTDSDVDGVVFDMLRKLSPYEEYLEGFLHGRESAGRACIMFAYEKWNDTNPNFNGFIEPVAIEWERVREIYEM